MAYLHHLLVHRLWGHGPTHILWQRSVSAHWDHGQYTSCFYLCSQPYVPSVLSSPLSKVGRLEQAVIPPEELCHLGNLGNPPWISLHLCFCVFWMCGRTNRSMIALCVLFPCLSSLRNEGPTFPCAMSSHSLLGSLFFLFLLPPSNSVSPPSMYPLHLSDQLSLPEAMCLFLSTSIC